MTAEQARQVSGFTLDEAARRARVCPLYLRRIERRGGAPWILGQRLSRLYQVPIDTFVFKVKAEKGGRREKAEERSFCEKSP